MLDPVRVISADKDGAELRREKTKNRLYTRATGKHDEVAIHEAQSRATKLNAGMWTIPEDAYERIFGKKEKRENHV